MLRRRHRSGGPSPTVPTLRVTPPQTGSEPLRVSNAAIGALRVTAYAALEPQDGFKGAGLGSAAARMTARWNGSLQKGHVRGLGCHAFNWT